MRLSGKNILIISPEKWATNMLSKHHYATALANRNNQIYFLNPPAGPHVSLTISSTENKNILIITYRPILVGLNRLIIWFPRLFNRLSLLQINRIKKELPELDVIWNFDAFRFQNLKLFNAKLAIFHQVDYVQTDLELISAQSSDLILAVSPAILERFKNIQRPSFLINHGLSQVFMDVRKERNKNLTVIRCGYVGNLLQFSIHWTFLMTIIRENPNVEFHFIGPYINTNLGESKGSARYVKELKQINNVVLHGEMLPSEVAEKINQFDLFLICYNAEEFAKITSNSHKILEYLSTGKVVVSSRISSYDHMEPGLFEMVNNTYDLPALFHHVADNLAAYNTPELQLMRINFAKRNSYNHHIDAIENITDKLGFE